MMRLFVAVAFGAAFSLAGCTYYAVPAPPGAYPVSSPASFDRSFQAATDAMRDQGLTITTQDRANGVVIGTAGSATVTANVRQQGDGSVRVQFDAKGADPSLIDRVSRSYDGRMGR
jgi:hypothetical protein